MNSKLIAAISAFVLMTSCKKHKPDIVTTPPTSSPYLKVILNPSYLPLAKIDSAFIIWQNGNKTDSVRLKPLDDDLVTSFSNLPSEEKQYQLLLFTSQALEFKKLLWQKEFVTAFAQKNALNIAAPLNINDINWKPRIILNDQAGLNALSGIRPSDPYFRIYKIDQSWKSFVMDRSYWYTIGPDTKVAGAEWKAANILDATGSYTNETFYSFLPERIGSRQWNHIEIVMLFTNDTNTQTRMLDFTYSFY